jgi:Dolichyl-phosphate-mannose-protein mannosyltransferase
MNESSVMYAMPRRLTRWPAITWPVCTLSILFLLSLPLVNPYVHGDGVGYYAYAQSLVIDHDLNFEDDWRAANPGFLQDRVDANGRLLAEEYTVAGRLRNHFSVGPTILWAPFLSLAHAGVILADSVGAQIPPNGYSRPYLVAMAASTVLYGFLGLLMAFDLARRHSGDTWAFLATLGIWFASSLPVYMYFNPAWSHAHSAFSVALFLWYWQRTRDQRSLRQWIVLGLAAGLMMNVYYPNAILMIVPAIEALVGYSRTKPARWGSLLQTHICFLATVFVALLPTLGTRWAVFGGPFESGYPPLSEWNWTSPVWLSVLFSANHGLLSWTPVLIPALLGLWAAYKKDALFGSGLLLSVLAFGYFISSYPDWDGLSSFGNRFFISLTPVFVIGLAATLDSLARWWNRPGSDVVLAGGILALLTVWNAGFIFQWGTQMIPSRGAISWAQMAHNQFAAVPARITNDLEHYLFRRDSILQRIEVRDLERRQSEVPNREP